MKNIFIISARRSGTHLLTDLILNNFNYTRIDNSIDYDFLTEKNTSEFIDTMYEQNKLAWSHSHDYENFFDKGFSVLDKLDMIEIFRRSKIIFIYRDIRDIITSYYYRPYIQEKHKTFIDFFNNCDCMDYKGITNYNGNPNANIIDLLIEQRNNWFSVFFSKELLGLDMEVISYEEIINNYDESIKKISKFLGYSSIDNIKDVRLKSLEDKDDDLVYTAHDFRHGNIGDWKYLFDDELGDEIKTKSLLSGENHIEPYLNATKLWEFHDPEKKYFHLNYRDWDETEKSVDNELQKIKNPFDEFTKVFNVKYLINNRYSICERKLDDVRYKHKVFYYHDYILKFIYPTKHLLDKITFNKVIPIASKMNLLTILKTYNKLYAKNYIPELYYAGIHQGILFVIQKRVDEKSLVNNLTNIDTNRKWEWMVNEKYFPTILKQFFSAIEDNILFTDQISPFNLSINGDNILNIDLDGIIHFNNKKELFNSTQYYNIINIFKIIDGYWIEKYGQSELNKY